MENGYYLADKRQISKAFLIFHLTEAKMKYLKLLLIIAVLFTISCTETKDTDDLTAESDSTTDTESDSTTDIESDSTTDIESDSTTDIESDSTTDIESDSTTDIESDSTTDTELEANMWALNYKNLTGKFQDGPCLAGAIVTVKPLNDSLNQVLGYYISETENDFGYYDLPVELTENYAEVFADAICHNEITGGIMVQKRLSAIIDLNAGESNNITPLTTIRTSVARNLFDSGHGTAGDSLLEAEILILEYMGMPSLNTRFTDMTLEDGNQADSVLLAVNSALLLNRTEAEQIDFMQKIASDINSGTDIYRSEFLQNIIDIPLLQVKSNREARYESLGHNMNVPPFWEVTGAPNYFSDLLERDPVVQSSFNLDDTGSCSFDQPTFNVFAIPYVFTSGIESSKYIALNLQGGDISIWTRDSSNDVPETKLVDIEQLNELLLTSPVTLPYNGMLPDNHGLESDTDYYIVISSDTDFTLSTSCGTVEPFFLPFGRKLAKDESGTNAWEGNLNNTSWWRKSGVKVFTTD